MKPTLYEPFTLLLSALEPAWMATKTSLYAPAVALATIAKGPTPAMAAILGVGLNRSGSESAPMPLDCTEYEPLAEKRCARGSAMVSDICPMNV